MECGAIAGTAMIARRPMSKNSTFFAAGSRNIFDKRALDTGFCQYLQGFCITKKVVIMTIGISAL
jgi:hypothetical protein